MPHCCFVGSIAPLFAFSIAAQTFVVDANSGPGTNFTDLPAAIAAVPDGSILLVRPGAYSPIALDQKAMTIVATGPGVTINQGSNIGIVVKNLAANQSVTIRGVRVTPGFTFVVALVDACAGPVLFDSYEHTSTPTYYSLYSSGLQVKNSAQVTLRDCTIQAARALETIGSTVTVDHCTLQGHDAYFVPHVGSYPGTGLIASTSNVELSRCEVRAGTSLGTPSPAISLFQSSLRLVEDGSAQCIAGSNPLNTATPAIDGTFSSVVRTPEAALVPANGGPPIAAGITDTIRPLPSLHATTAPPGGVVAVDVTTPIGEAVFAFLALPIAPVVVPGIDGTLWIDPFAIFVSFGGVPAAGQPLTTTFNVPNDPTLVGARFVWQALAISGIDGLRLGNPSIYTH